LELKNEKQKGSGFKLNHKKEGGDNHCVVRKGEAGNDWGDNHCAVRKGEAGNDFPRVFKATPEKPKLCVTRDRAKMLIYL